VPSDLPLREAFEPVEWILAGLLAVNLVLFAAIVVQREQWVLHERLRARIRERLAPMIERLLEASDAEQAAEEMRPLVAGLGPQARPVAAWLVLDGLRDADAATRAAACRVLAESGAIERAERSTRSWMPWRRALACELLGTIGAASSVDVLVPRLQDRRAEVRMAAARALGRVGDPAAAEPLAKVFLERRNVPIGVANDALIRLGEAGADAFRQGLRSPEPTVRITSCFGIASEATGDATTQALGLLADRLRSDAEPRVRSAAASAMRWLPGDTTPPALLEGLHDPADAVRRSAARSLAAFDDTAAVAALAGTVGDGDRETALRSAESLLALADGAQAGEPARRALAATRAWTVDWARTTAEPAP
jgi:HEAT repeat protein